MGQDAVSLRPFLHALRVVDLNVWQCASRRVSVDRPTPGRPALRRSLDDPFGDLAHGFECLRGRQVCRTSIPFSPMTTYELAQSVR